MKETWYVYVSGNCAHKLEAILFSENSQTQRASATWSKDQEWNDGYWKSRCVDGVRGEG